MLATQVIATGISHLTDARYFAAWEVDYLAFQLGKGGVDWLTLDAMREWITGPRIGVEPGNGAAAEASGLAEALGNRQLSFAVLPDTASTAAQNELLAAGLAVFVRLPVAGYQSGGDLEESVAATAEGTQIILDFEAGGISWPDLMDGHPFGLNTLRQLAGRRPLFLQIDLSEADPKSVADTHPIAGFAVRGSSEEKVGYKSFDDLDPLFEALETFDD